MGFPMTRTAKGNEILRHIRSQLAARLHMMNLQIFEASASLAPPAITLEHLLTKAPIEIPVQATLELSWDWWIHEVFGIRSKNSCRCEFGSNT
jgi:hypothetical protein